MKWLGRYPLSTWLEAIAQPLLWLGRDPLRVFWFLFAIVVVAGTAIFRNPPPPLTPEQQAAMQATQQHSAERAEQKRAREAEVREQKARLCRWAVRCRQYDAARLECATAGDFNMCVKIKMGNEADYIGACSGFKEGAPAINPSPETPTLFECFFLTLGG
jgi:hypothetical protein